MERLFASDDENYENPRSTFTRNVAYTCNDETHIQREERTFSPFNSYQETHYFVSEYGEDVYYNDLQMEKKFPLRNNFLHSHSVTPYQRENTLKYILNACNIWELPLEVLYLSVSIFDRFLQTVTEIPEDCLKILATGVLRIALKIEHRQSELPSTSEFVQIGGEIHNNYRTLAIEKKICSVMEFNFSYPYSISFFRRLSKIASLSILEYYLGLYLLEISLFNLKTCTVYPSKQAAAACCLALRVFKVEADFREIWTSDLVEMTGYSLRELIPVINDLVHGLLVIAAIGPQSELYQKYARMDNYMISSFQQIREPHILSSHLLYCMLFDINNR